MCYNLPLEGNTALKTFLGKQRRESVQTWKLTLFMSIKYLVVKSKYNASFSFKIIFV